jgi:hypothetical protein
MATSGVALARQVPALLGISWGHSETAEHDGKFLWDEERPRYAILHGAFILQHQHSPGNPDSVQYANW